MLTKCPLEEQIAEAMLDGCDARIGWSDRLDALLAPIRKVLERHQPEGNDYQTWCKICDDAKWPCPEARLRIECGWGEVTIWTTKVRTQDGHIYDIGEGEHPPKHPDHDVTCPGCLVVDAWTEPECGWGETT